MDATELTRLRELCDKATPGPWEYGVTYLGAGINDGTWKAPADLLPGQCVLCQNPEGVLVGQHVEKLPLDGKDHVVHVHRFPDYDDDNWRRIWSTAGNTIIGGYDYDCGGVASTEADAAFIAAARTALPALLDDLAAVTAERDRLAGELAALRTQLREEVAPLLERLVALGCLIGTFDEAEEHAIAAARSWVARMREGE